MGNPSSDSEHRRSEYARRRIAVIIVAVVATAGFLCASRLNYNPQKRFDEQSGLEQNRAQAVAMAPLPLRSSSPFLNTSLDVEYVGSDRCRDCHEQEYLFFAATLHRQSLSRVNPNNQTDDAVFDHQLSRRSYRVERSAFKLWHRGSLLDGDGRRTELAAYALSYQVGSGHVAKSFLVEEGGFLLQSPLTWFAEGSVWEMSPGYDLEDHSSFNRVITSGCLYCHTGHLRNPGRHGFRHRIAELSIGCERCHGPGELHVRQHSEGSDGDFRIDRTIVNPKHLSRELSEAICSQCHLQGDYQVSVRGCFPEDYRPGLPLREFRVDFRKVDPSAKLKVAGHVEQLHQSRCYQGSNTLTCITCHQPHGNPMSSKQIAHSQAVCSSCHQDQSCGLPLSKRKTSKKNNCVECHMPRTETEVVHVALTDHRIGIHSSTGRRSDVRSTKKISTSLSVMPLLKLDHLSKADRDRAWGLAYLTLVRTSSGNVIESPRFTDAVSFLRQSYEGGVRDPETLTALAGIARVTGNLRKAEQLALEALNSKGVSPRNRIESLDILAEVHFRTGRLVEAAEVLRQATQYYPNPLHWYLLGKIERRLGHRDNAIAAMRHAVRLAPGAATYHRALESLLQAAGNKDEAEFHRDLADRLSAVPTKRKNTSQDSAGKNSAAVR